MNIYFYFLKKLILKVIQIHSDSEAIIMFTNSKFDSNSESHIHMLVQVLLLHSHIIKNVL